MKSHSDSSKSNTNSNIINPKQIDFINQFELIGKSLYGDKFTIYDHDQKIIIHILAILFQNETYCVKHNLDPYKGILLTGPIGCGKTSIMSIAKLFLPYTHRYLMASSRQVAAAFSKHGYDVIDQMSSSKPICFDDLGIEHPVKHFGTDCNVLGDIFLNRYELFVKQKIITHATTNLNAEELEKHYGNRVRSRMRAMFNLISFDREAKDKRR
jgi:DNA replication protein DnaC